LSARGESTGGVVQSIVWGWSWLTGPIFDKELRVSSRRRRNYVLRVAYVALFVLFASIVWLNEMPHGSPSVLQVSRMARAGTHIVLFVVWFQFMASQVIAIVLLSTAISDEIYGKTLGLLMTTPIGSLQIVLGKLLSKLLQLMLLLAITLPLLAIVRLLGGVPWGYLIGGLCITLSTAVFCGSLSLFFSIFTRKAYVAIITAMLAAGAYFALVPLVAFLMFHEVVSERVILATLGYVNPYVTLMEATDHLVMARGASGVNWAAHCGLSLAGSALLLLCATVFVRKVALRQATGQPIYAWGQRKREQARAHEKHPQASLEAATRGGAIRRVAGAPVLWKERRAPLLGRWGVGKIVGAILAAGMVILTYVLCAREEILGDEEVQVMYVVLFFGAALLFTIVLPATCITSEKESRSWPILLTTTVTDWGILGGKFLGAARQCSAAWLPLLIHVGLFAASGTLHPVILAQLGITVVWTVMFLCATGLYFSTRLSRTTTAVIANFSVAAGLWGVIPLLLVMIVEMLRIGTDMPSTYMDLNPFVHAVAITAGTVHGIGNYEWVTNGRGEFGATMGWIAITTVLYLSIAGIFLLTARRHLRSRAV
jgi:ABC-type transport system involved in multi-copper enzyme maturation permease subunit